MKWVQTKDGLDDDGVNAEERKNLFKEYKTKEELEYDLADPKKFEKWVTYPDDDPLHKKFELERKAQRKYEVFCGGFLHYHDVVFKKYPDGGGYEYPKPGAPFDTPPTWKSYDGDKTFDHEIYFEWFPKDKKVNKKTRVIIHITPTPEKYNSIPPKPPPPPPPESNG